MLQLIESKVKNQERLTEQEALWLFQNASLDTLGALANESKQKLYGSKVYYVHNRQINYTNICVLKCKFCAFSQIKPDSPEAYDWSIEQIVQKAKEVAQKGARELHIVGGLHPDHSFDYYLEMLGTLQQECPQVNLKAFTAVEILHFSKISGLSVEQVLAQLKSVGLVSLTGGGAEILVPEIRKQICSPKDTGEEWLSVHRMAHSMGLVSNATMLFGHIEAYSHRVAHMALIRQLQDDTQGFNSFIPLVFHPENTNLQHKIPQKTPPEDRLRTIAVARLFLDNIPHIKAYWVHLGLETAAKALHFGASDLDGTIVEEKITKAAGSSAGIGMTVDALRGLIEKEGLIPVERDALYTEYDVQAR
jgi:aminodeoxyfutalosine synthase